ncbi:MAG: hypothetical protein KatS3mg076_0211 [Candidatus Binatia bacterium]|nr:MAG: hypothetical protein KatS3mg076_0211 [Candidatus Binatia bacterium]
MTELGLSLLLASFLLLLGASAGRLRFLAVECGSSRVRQALCLVLLLGVLALTVVHPLVAGLPGPRPFRPLGLGELFVGHFVLVAFLAAWWLATRRPPLRRFLVWPRRRSLEALRAGVRAGIVGWFLAVLGTGTLASLVGLFYSEVSPPEPPEALLWLVGLPFAERLLVIGVAMTVEEAFFRAFLQPRIGLVPSSLLFAVAHFSYGLPFLVVGVSIVSFVLGVLFRRTRHILACIIAHGTFDAIQLLLVLPILARFVR